jgi:siroheme synthase
LVSEAQRGRRVVRLHAGDSGVFGRSAEELEALAEAGIEAEIVPGVSAVLAAAAAAGFPLTARGTATSFRVTTAHTREGYVTALETAPAQETLVILMGLARAREILAGLIEAGRDPATPAVAIDSAGRAGERVVRGTLAELADRIEAAGLRGPATLVVGAVASRGRGAPQASQEDAA